MFLKLLAIFPLRKHGICKTNSACCLHKLKLQQHLCISMLPALKVNKRTCWLSHWDSYSHSVCWQVPHWAPQAFIGDVNKSPTPGSSPEHCLQCLKGIYTTLQLTAGEKQTNFFTKKTKAMFSNLVTSHSFTLSKPGSLVSQQMLTWTLSLFRKNKLYFSYRQPCNESVLLQTLTLWCMSYREICSCQGKIHGSGDIQDRVMVQSLLRTINDQSIKELI